MPQITSHIMNHLWHFPLGVGAQRLSSLVVEGDDVPGLTSDELSSEVFLSPHVQLFALNQSCLLSLVQLPALQVPGGAATVGFKTPNSEVREDKAPAGIRTGILSAIVMDILLT